MTDYSAHCHCGKTEWTAKLETEQQGHILCHCDTCKYLSGSTFTLNQIIPRSALNITKGESSLGKYTYYGDSGKGVHCYFCPTCTSHVYHHQEVMGPDTIVLRTGLLTNGIKEFEPKAEIFGKARLGWEKEVAQTFETMPPA
ncbi:Mss4-like protein [Massariosphaeria phaeospora]|uniref:Mss4-like protein n=1 Tax=Massariosphaeria phaeospora TaxID=100035 RepID=A0A7C8IEG7_9PLEO|nr:Mss4-like protein [Massariosphaeria phaeospora]